MGTELVEKGAVQDNTAPDDEKRERARCQARPSLLRPCSQRTHSPYILSSSD